MRRVLSLSCLTLLISLETFAGGGLFGRRLRVSEETPPAQPAPKKSSADEPEDPFAQGRPAQDERKSREHAAPSEGDKGDKPSREDGAVRIRPIEFAQAERDLPVDSRMEFRLSRIDKPLSTETSALFQTAWVSFRKQHILVEGSFERLPGAPLPLRVTLRQDLGDGRWLVDASWSNSGALAWCAPGANKAQAVVVLDAPGNPGEQRAISALRIGLVEASFVSLIPPAEGHRVRVRRQAFVESSPLPDDEVTRAAFQSAVAAGRNLKALVVQEQDCRSCGGVGYIRRKIPGKIQDARDPCPGNCERGHRQVGLEVTFRP
jgi:hypothetical protein